MKSSKRSERKRKVKKRINSLYVRSSLYRYTFVITVISAGIVAISGSQFTAGILISAAVLSSFYEMLGEITVKENKTTLIFAVIFIVFNSFFGTAMYELEIYPFILCLCFLELFICENENDAVYKDMLFPAAVSMIFSVMLYSVCLLLCAEKGIYCILAVTVCVLTVTGYDTFSGHNTDNRYILNNEYTKVSVRRTVVGSVTGTASVLLFGVVIRSAQIADISSTAGYVFFSFLIPCSVQFGRLFIESLKKPLKKRSFSRLFGNRISVLENIGGYIISMPVSFLFLETTNIFSPLTA